MFGQIKCFDVVIIGAGLAGLQCAKLLSQQGAKILLHENFLRECIASGVEFANGTRYIPTEINESENFVKLEKAAKIGKLVGRGSFPDVEIQNARVEKSFNDLILS